MADGYAYPDTEDRITAAFIAEREPHPGYWECSEAQALRMVDEHARTAAEHEPTRMLDAGCGEGRLLARFAPLFSEVVAVDPDRTRLEAAERLAQERGFAGKTRFLRVGAEEIADEEPFSFILCSHVLQHVSTAHAERILDRLSRLLVPGGVFVALTTHAAAKADRFVRARIVDGSVREDPVGREEFDRLVRSAKGTLPIRFFSRATLRDLLEKRGLGVLSLRVFHCLEDFGDGLVDRDANANATPQLQERFGRDVCVVARRR